MEVIPLDSRDRSTTILNTAAPSDAYNYTPDNTTNNDAVSSNIIDTVVAETDPQQRSLGPANKSPLFTRRNKLLLTIAAATALLCAMAAGSGVAIHRARMNAANRCFVEDALISNGSGVVGGSKSSKSPKSKSSKSPKSSGSPITRMLTGSSSSSVVGYEEEEESLTASGLMAYYPSGTKRVEHKRMNRMLAEHLGEVDGGGLSWMSRWFLWSAAGGGLRVVENHGDGWMRRRRLDTAKSSKSPSVKSSKSPVANLVVSRIVLYRCSLLR